MKNIIGVRFKKLGKIYFFNPQNLKMRKGLKVIAETSQGEEYGEVVIPNRFVSNDEMIKPLKKIIRIANYRDYKRHLECIAKEKEAFKVCQKKIKDYNLKMTLNNVECKFDDSKMIFYFTADGRIDFRDLAKDLAMKYKTRIELRQIGVRDEVKRLGGNGICGRELCCCSFLRDFEAVSIKMAKVQNLSLNPTKISGNCGRLMCCLKYENEVYEEKVNRLPKVGDIVKTVDGEGVVDSIEVLAEKIRVKIKDGEGYLYKKYNTSDIKILKSNEEELISDCEINELEELENL